MEGQNIAKLVASLGFQIEDKQLNTFLFKIQQTVTALKGIKEVAQNKINFKIGLDKTDITSAKTHIEGLGKTKIRLTSMSVGYQALAEIREQIRSAMGSKLNLHVNVKEANSELVAWAKRTNDKFKLNVKAQVSKRALAQSLREATQYATEVVGVLKLKDPKVKVGIDKEHLRTEIRDALAHIQKEVRIKIDLTGQVSGGAPRSGGGGGGRTSHAGLAGAAGVGAAGGMMESARTIVPGLGAVWGIGQLSKTSQELAAVDATMLMVAGSTEAAATQMTFLKKIGFETGQTLLTIGPMYAQIIAASKGTGLEGQAGQDVFAGIMRYGATMSMNEEDMKGTLRGFTQMISKQQVYAEELKNQVGEHMPTAVKMSADVMNGVLNKDTGIYEGGDTAKLMKAMEAGQLKPDILLPRLAAQMEKLIRIGGAYDRTQNSSARAQGRFRIALLDSIKAFSDAGFDRTMFNFWYEITDAIKSVEDSAKGLARGFELLMVPVIATIRLASKLVEYWPKIAAYLGLTSEKAGVLAGVVLGLIFPWTRMLTLISLGATALDDFTTYLAGGSSEFGTWMKSLSPENQEAIKTLGNALIRLGEALIALGGTIATGWTEIFKTLSGVGFETAAINSITSFANAVSTLAEALTALGNADISKLKELGNAFGWMSMQALGGDEDTWSRLTDPEAFPTESAPEGLTKLMATIVGISSERMFGKTLTDTMKRGNDWTREKMGVDEATLSYERNRPSRAPASQSSANYGGTPRIDPAMVRDNSVISPVNPISEGPVVQQPPTPVVINISELKLDNVQDPQTFISQFQNAISLEWPAEI